MIEELKKNADSYLKSIKNIADKYENKQKNNNELTNADKDKGQDYLIKMKEKINKPNQKDSIALAKNGNDENKLDNSEEEKKPGFEKNRLRHPDDKGYERYKEQTKQNKTENKSHNQLNKEDAKSTVNRVEQDRKKLQENKQHKNKNKERYR